MKIVAFVLILAFFLSCSRAPLHQSGLDKMAQGNLTDAVSDLEAAQKNDDKNEDLAIELSEAKFKFAAEDLQKISILNKNDYPTILFHLKRAKGHIENSLELLAKVTDADLEPKKNLSEKKALLEKITAELTPREAEYQKILAKVQSLKAADKNKIENTFIDCQNLSVFRDFVPEVKEVIVTLSDLLVADLEKKGLEAFDKQKITDAKKNFDKILKYFPDHRAGLEGQLCLQIYEGNKKQDYRKAYAGLLEMKGKNPSSACVTKFEKTTLEKLIKTELSQAHAQEKEKKVASLLKVIDHYQFLIALEGMSPEQKKSFTEGVSKARLGIASLLLSKAKSLRASSRESLPLVATILKMAYRFHPEETKKNLALMEEADLYIKEKNEFKIMLYTKKGENPLLGELEATLRQRLVTTASGTLVVEMAGEENALRQFKDLSKNGPKGVDYALWMQLLDYKAEEYGANQPFYKTSRYVSGTRALDNPDWFAAQQEYNSAQNDYNASYQYNQQMKSQCNNMNNPFAAGLCSGMVSGLSTASLDNARATLNATPRYIQENIISDYTYRQYKVGVNLYIRMAIQFYDLNTKSSFPEKIMEYKVTRKEGEILEGVQPSDVNGIREGRINVPVLSGEKMDGQNKLASDIDTELKTIVAKERGLRYCRSANKKNETSLLASYQLCVTYAPKEEELKEKAEQQKMMQAQKKLGEFYQLTQSDIQKYALTDAELPNETNLFR